MFKTKNAIPQLRDIHKKDPMVKPKTRSCLPTLHTYPAS